MRIDRHSASEIASWVLVLSAVLTTLLIVRREFVQEETTTAPEARYVDGWEDALTIGRRSGPADAPVQVVEFADFECPYCALFETTMQAVRDKYPDQVAFTMAYYPLSNHLYAESAARAAECAHRQGRFEAMRVLLFEEQQAFGSVPWTHFAEQVGISDIEQFDACVNDIGTFERLEQGKKLGDQLGVRGTPTVLINGWQMPGAPTPEMFDMIVNNVLEGRLPAENMVFHAKTVRN